MGRQKEKQAGRALRAALAGQMLRAAEKGWLRLPTGPAVQILQNTAAAAFGRKGRRVWYLPRQRALEEFAAFTAACLRGMPDPAADRRLYRQALGLGRRIRRVSGLSRREDLQRLVFFLYRMIGIDMAGHLPGEITVASCFFSRFYGPEQCARMSRMDAGVLAGICGNGNLVFTERITEGCGRCRACYGFTHCGSAGESGTFTRGEK